ncbi:MAG: hypothetical protein ABIQ11_01390, partial [Saprospiraceae bacterium]
MMKIFRLLSVVATMLFLSACGGGGDVSPKSKEFELYIDFWNNTGTTPQITFDAVNTSPEVKID